MRKRIADLEGGECLVVLTSNMKYRPARVVSPVDETGWLSYACLDGSDKGTEFRGMTCPEQEVEV